MWSMPKSIKNSPQLLEALKEVQKKFGKEALNFLSESYNKNIATISSGFLPLNLALGVGGYPKGRILEIYGPERF